MKFQVTQEHIDKGERGRCVGCPIQLCLAEALKEPNVRVDQTNIWLAGTVNRQVSTPVELIHFINRFDHKEHSAPFEFELPGSKKQILRSLNPTNKFPRSVYVDKLFTRTAREAQAARVGARNCDQWCHMFSTDVRALHRLAERIGMKPEWFQDRERLPHYDLTPARRNRAIGAGAIELSLKSFLRYRTYK